ncbi:MAG: hypothetical protein HY231_14670 [Acidobacteria bacterium]|nr:hypothetical protein [Acidobacteriota bacterium]
MTTTSLPTIFRRFDEVAGAHKILFVTSQADRTTHLDDRQQGFAYVGAAGENLWQTIEQEQRSRTLRTTPSSPVPVARVSVL